MSAQRVVDGQFAAIGDGELFSHQIQTANLFADGVFHLQTGIDLQEIHLALLGHHEFASAQTDVVDRFEKPA